MVVRHFLYIWVMSDEKKTCSRVTSHILKSKADFTSTLVHGLAFGTQKFYTELYDKINRGLVIL